MERLYKYSMLEHAIAMVKRGRFRIGTLYEYRNVEIHGSAIGDVEEGTFKTILDAKEQTSFSLDDGSPEATYFNHHWLQGPGRGKAVRIVLKPKVKLTAITNTEDMYVFCVSTRFDRKAMLEFGYNACVVIEQPGRFLHALSRALRHVAVFEGFGPIVYSSRESDYLTPHKIHPALLKGSEYAYQAEGRALWKPSGQVVEPFFATCRRAARYCSLMNPNFAVNGDGPRAARALPLR